MSSNELFLLNVPAHGVTDGHIHFDLAKVDPQSVAITGLCANVISALLFERLGAQGSNIVCTLSADAGTLDVISRASGDGLGLIWDPLTIDVDKLNEVQARIQDKTFTLTHAKTEHLPAGHEQKTAHANTHAGHKEKHHEGGHGHHLSEEEEEAFVKQITRIP